MNMKVVCLNKILIGENRSEATFGFSGYYEIEVDADTFGEASDLAMIDDHVPTTVQSPTGNWITVPKTEGIFIHSLPSVYWPIELANSF